MFVRKGTYVAHRYGKGEYCALLIFVSDDFIRTVVDKYPASADSNPKGGTLMAETGSIFPLQMDESLSAYFHSVLSYFSKDVSPPSALLKIKFEELLLNILTGRQNRPITGCLREIHETGKISLRHVMETSFMHQMSLGEYARLCARSLTSFKADFYKIYKITPGKWLISARLQHAKVLVQTTDESINDVAFKSGFKNTAHFVKVFKEHYGMPPLQYRLRRAVGVWPPKTALAHV
ncbi:MAG: AraC family transcriptional regulator [Cyclobacteriaceae bacterium]